MTVVIISKKCIQNKFIVHIFITNSFSIINLSYTQLKFIIIKITS